MSEPEDRKAQAQQSPDATPGAARKDGPGSSGAQGSSDVVHGVDDSAFAQKGADPSEASGTAADPTCRDPQRIREATASVAREYGPGPESNRSKDSDEAFREWYQSMLGSSSQQADENQTIGLLGGRSSGHDRYNLNRRSRARRMKQMLDIVRRYDILHGLTPTTLRQMLEELGPTFVKAGQILSMRSEILPEPFLRELSKLRADVEPMDRDVVLDALRHEYNRPIEDIFDAIDDVPLGSASVAQVHKARLITGELVAVKVQRPGVQEVMAQDIDIMRTFARYADRIMDGRGGQFLDFQSVVEELWQSFREETDFMVEARSLDEFRRNNADCKFVGCPKPYLGLCTEHVVVMDYVQGIPISQTDRLKQAGYDLEEIGQKLVDNYTQQMLDDGFFHGDPHPGNIIISGGKIVYIDLGIMGRLSAHDRAAMSDMVVAVGKHDTALLERGLLRFSISDNTSVDHSHLLADLDEIVDEYGNADLSELDIGRMLNAIIALAQRHGIELPSSVTMLARALVTLEGVVDEFLPGVSMVQIVAAHLKAHRDWKDTAKGEAKKYTREVHAASHGLLRAAAQAPLAMNMLTRGQLRMNLDLPGTTDPIADFSHAFDRLTMGIIIAGLFIGSSVIYYARIQPVIFGIPIIGFLGFLIALVLGLWVVIDIMRESHGRKRKGR
ncbi:MAG: ABC1 kinase family protein [Atopobiaceae bacterium]